MTARKLTFAGIAYRVSEELRTRKEAWADAYRHTPHGRPVELR
jgi:hypothetical protein